MSRWLTSVEWVTGKVKGSPPIIDGRLVVDALVPGDVHPRVEKQPLRPDEQTRFFKVRETFPGIHEYTLADWAEMDTGYAPYYIMRDGRIYRTESQREEAVCRVLRRANELVRRVLGDDNACPVEVGRHTDILDKTNGTSADGYFDADTQVVVLRYEFIIEASDARILNLMLHEIAHYVTCTYTGMFTEGHGPIWNNVALALGCNGRETNEVVNDVHLPAYVIHESGIVIKCTNDVDPCWSILDAQEMIVGDRYVKFETDGTFSGKKRLAHKKPLVLVPRVGQRMSDAVRQTNTEIDAARRGPRVPAT